MEIFFSFGKDLPVVQLMHHYHQVSSPTRAPCIPSTGGVRPHARTLRRGRHGPHAHARGGQAAAAGPVLLMVNTADVSRGPAVAWRQSAAPSGWQPAGCGTAAAWRSPGTRRTQSPPLRTPPRPRLQERPDHPARAWHPVTVKDHQSGRGRGRPAPSHTTGHAGPHPAVRQAVWLRRCLVWLRVCRPRRFQYVLGRDTWRTLEPATRQYPLLLPAHLRALRLEIPRIRRLCRLAAVVFHSFQRICRRRRRSHPSGRGTYSRYPRAGSSPSSRC